MQSRNYLFALLAAICCACAPAVSTNVSPAATVETTVDDPRNILFIAVDDLKPLLSNYGEKQMKTPNFDRLAAMGVTFTNAHVQYAVCGPSRASIMTGTFPDRNRVWDLHTDFRESNPDLVSMPEYLTTQGYATQGIGKIYHKGSSAPGHDGKSWSLGHELPKDYNAAYGEPAFAYYQNPATKAKFDELMAEAEKKGIDKQGEQRKFAFDNLKPSTESADVPDDAYQDGVYTLAALEAIKNLNGQDKPWFLAVGYQKPHLPFVAPQKYWDMYDRDELDLAAWQQEAAGTPRFAYHNFGELRAYSDIDEDLDFGDKVDEAKQRELIHGYMACVSYIDAQLGKLLDALEQEGIAETTDIVLWGDHGFHLGDHTLWCKHSNFEQATHIPLMFAGPGVKKGEKVDAPVNLVDVFPTLYAMAGVAPSPQQEGKSLLPLMDGDAKTGIDQDYAISQYRRGNDDREIMGYSLRTDRFRYAEWHKGYHSYDAYSVDNIKGVELYDYQNDPLETKNLAEDQEFFGIAEKLHDKLQSHLTEQRTRLSKPVGSMPASDRQRNLGKLPPGAEPKAKAPTGSLGKKAKEGTPNILFIHVDDFGYYDLGFTGSKIYQTPNIDRLAMEGIRFEHAYTNYPRCTPSRYALMSGNYPVNEDYGDLKSIPNQQSLPHRMDALGYHSFYVGKWHLGDEDNAPKELGFDVSYAAGHAGGVGQRFYPFNIKRNGQRHKEQVLDVEQDGKEGDYISDLMTDKMLDIIKDRPAGQPFYGHLAYYAVHTPLEGKPADRERNAKEIAAFDFGDGPEYIEELEGRRKMRQDHPDYAAMVENVDENVGRILKYLDDNDLAENTIVVLTSDHGGLSNDGNKRQRDLATTNLPFRAGKGHLYEGGVRVPLILRWPAQIEPRAETESIIMGMDLLPTLLDLAGNEKVNGIDGKSFKAVIEGNETWSDRTVFWHSRKARPHSTGDIETSAIRSGEYKLLDFYEAGYKELYNVIEDPGETNDLSKTMAAKTKSLSTVLDAWKKEYLVPERMDMKKMARKAAENDEDDE